MTSEDNDQCVYRVVFNHEEQYSIWPFDKTIPAGWIDANKHGSKRDCLAYISATWTDIRPKSLREV